MTLLDQLETRLSSKFAAKLEKIDELPSDWIEKYFYVPDPRDPITGDFLPAGPMRLAEHQKRIINEALSKNPDGTFKYATVIYSAPKKSGKSAIAAAVTLYMAFSRTDSFIYCLANDGKQSADRIYDPIKRTFRLHRKLEGPFADENPNKTEVVLTNNTKIEAVPCDAAGEAGSQPLFTVYSELWGFDTDAKQRLFTEMTVPPTLWGYAMRWIESYAGFVGKSILLEGLYKTATQKGKPHPDFEDLKNSDGSPTVWVNERAKMFCYWDHEPRMIWQTEDYYSVEAQTHSSSEFLRVHRNQWVSDIDAFIDASSWERLKKNLGPIRAHTPVVLGVDAAISNDFATIVGVTRDPDDNEDIAIRFCYIYTPQQGGGKINISGTLEPKIRELCARHNVVCVAYDKYQIEDMAQRLRRDRVVWMYNFSQQNERAIADKKFHDRIMNQTVWWDEFGDNINKNGDLPTLYQHVTQAGKKELGGKLRLEKLSNDAKIDAAVAASMAIERAATLNIQNKERNSQEILRLYSRGELTDEELSEALRS